MAKKSNLDLMIEKFRSEVPEFVSTDIVEIETGLSVGGGSIFPDSFDSSVASALFAEVVKANQRAMEALGGDANVGTVEDILITTSKSYVLLLVYPNRKYYHGLAITRQGNLAFARIVMRKFQADIIKALP